MKSVRGRFRLHGLAHLFGLFGLLALSGFLCASCAAPGDRRATPRSFDERLEELYRSDEEYREEQLGRRSDELKGIACQGLIGITRYEEEPGFDHEHSLWPGGAARTGFPTIPLLGLSVQVPAVGERFCAGGEGGVQIGWWYDSAHLYDAGGAEILRVVGRLFTLDFHLGAYVSADLAERLRIYAGAGPMALLGYYRADVRENDPVSGTAYGGEDVHELALGFGTYARAGLELVLDESSLWGVGVRRTDVTLDFGGSAGEVDLDGTQFFMSWTLRF